MPPPKDPIKYEEYRRKLSEAGKRRYEDPEVRLKQSEAWKGEKNPNFGKSPSEDTRRKLREAVKLRVPASDETRRKLSEAGKRRYENPEVGLKQGEAQRGEKNPNFGKKMSDEQRQKISESRKKRFEDPIKGEETRRKISEAAKKRFEDPIRGEVIRRKISGTLKNGLKTRLKVKKFARK